MSTIMTASNQWASRPDDQRFTSLTDLNDHLQLQRSNSRAKVVPSRSLFVEPAPDSDHRGLRLRGPDGNAVGLTHWSFSQLAQRAGAPAAYLRELPADLASDNLNYGLQVSREVEDIGVLLYKNGGPAELRAVTGPQYGRVWNGEVSAALVDRFGDGINGHFRVPGEFGKRITVTKANTTLYASDRDMFVFLADEDRRIEVPNRRNGQPGSLARGFFVWNSDTGGTSFGVATFLFDYVCCNRIIWGANEYKELRFAHNATAPARWIEQVAPALEQYASGSTASVTAAIEAARAAKLETDNVIDWLRSRKFTAKQAAGIAEVHLIEEMRPIETLWDAATAITAFARAVPHQDERVRLERAAGAVMQLASA